LPESGEKKKRTFCCQVVREKTSAQFHQSGTEKRVPTMGCFSAIKGGEGKKKEKGQSNSFLKQAKIT